MFAYHLLAKLKVATQRAHCHNVRAWSCSIAASAWKSSSHQPRRVDMSWRPCTPNVRIPIGVSEFCVGSFGMRCISKERIRTIHYPCHTVGNHAQIFHRIPACGADCVSCGSFFMACCPRSWPDDGSVILVVQTIEGLFLPVVQCTIDVIVLHSDTGWYLYGSVRSGTNNTLLIRAYRPSRIQILSASVFPTK